MYFKFISNRIYLYKYNELYFLIYKGGCQSSQTNSATAFDLDARQY